MPATASTPRARIWKRTPIRLALAFAALAAVAYIVTTLAAYAVLRVQLLERQDQRVEEIFSLLSASADPDDQNDLLQAVRTQIAAARQGHFVFELRSETGKVMATNIPDVRLPLGWSKEPGRLFGKGEDGPQYRVLVGKVGDDQLLVGVDYSELDTLRRTIQIALGGSSLLALLMALGGSVVIAMRVQTRLNRIEDTMARVAEGDLEARLALTGAGDDIDHVSDQVNSALSRLSRLVEGMRQVSTDIAHDLRTPLNRLQLMLSEAQKRAERGEDSLPLLEAALNECAGIGATFSALLRIAQIEAGARRARFALVDPAAILANVADVYADVAEDAGMVLSCEAEGQGALISGDAELLTQCFANLIENAIRHCPRGTQITCRATRGPEGLCLTIADNGPGIPEEECEKVFRRLYRLQHSRTTPGSGLGLSLAKAVADLHDAEIRLSDAGPGLLVSLRFTPVA